MGILVVGMVWKFVDSFIRYSQEGVLYWCWMWVHCKKRLAVFPSRERSVSDIPAGDGKAANPLLTVWESKACKGTGGSEVYLVW